jgi:glycosyltransferase involved in cell wall biosynthesis
VVFRARREILWEQVELPKRLRQTGIDVFHATANRGLPYRRACKYIVTCHDVIDRLPEYCVGESWRGGLRKKYADFVTRHSADQYITVSEFSKQDICRFHGLSEERVVVIYNAANRRFYETLPAEKIARVRNKYALPPEYLLFLGGFDKKKNVTALVEAFAHVQDERVPHDLPSLVLAGERKWDFALVDEKIKALRLNARIVCPGQIDDEDLPAVYQGALALVHPSRYEGFGLQLVEAMASGVPVLASETTSLPEVLGGSGLLFNPEDADSIAHQMTRIVSDRALRNDLAAKSRQRATYFSWRKAAEQTIQVYLEVIGRRDDILKDSGQDSSAKLAAANPERYS